MSSSPHGNIARSDLWARGALTLYARAYTRPHTAAASLPRRVGQLELAEHQQRATARLLQTLARYRGAILADGVGLGKTRVALACAAWWPSSKPALICAPSRLLPQWRQACVSAGLAPNQDIFLTSHESMSRTSARQDPEHATRAGLLLVDEAHRMRNPKAQRAQTLARWAASAPTLLISATPICSSTWDLYALLRVFLSEDDLRAELGLDLRTLFKRASPQEHGAQDEALLDELVATCIVRRQHLPQPSYARPDVELELLAYQNSEQERWLWTNLEPALRALSWTMLDEQWPKPLLIEHLLRRWESGPRALLTSLNALAIHGQRWLEAQARGLWLDRRALLAHLGEDDAQGVLSFVWDELPTQTTPATQAQAQLVRDDLSALELIIERVRALEDYGCGRTRAVADLLKREPFTKALIFTSYEDTALRLYESICARLGPKAQVGLITGRQARATGLGRANPQELLRRFAPHAQGVKPPVPSQRLRVLIATDCLAEGVNLQDCGCVILTDLPYSPLGVEQRVGRLVRPGGEHLRVRVILPRPTDWRDSLGMRRRLDQKLEQAALGHLPMPLSEQLLRPRTASIQDPLRAIDALDRLAAQHKLDAELGAGWWRILDDKPRPALALACFSAGQHQRLEWLTISAAQPTTPRRLSYSELVPALISLIDLRAPLEPVLTPCATIQALIDLAQHRLLVLRSIQQAPCALPQGSAQWLVWAKLTHQAAQAPPSSRSSWAQALELLQRRLLRPLPRGLELKLLAALERPETLRQELIAWLPEPEDEPLWRLSWLGGLI